MNAVTTKGVDGSRVSFVEGAVNTLYEQNIPPPQNSLHPNSGILLMRDVKHQTYMAPRQEAKN